MSNYMLSPDDLLYFIHIPKTAGTTLISLLDAHFDVKDIFPAQLWKELAKLPPTDVGKYRLYRGHFGADGLKPFLPKPPVRITMLRQPIPLSLSTYKFVLREPGTRVHKLVMSENMSFSDFIQHPKTRSRISNKQTRNLSFILDEAPIEDALERYAESREHVDQWLEKYRIPLSDWESMEQAKETLMSCAFFGLVERFDESMALMTYTFGWAPIGTVEKLRAATTPEEVQALPEEALALLNECNEMDTELYAYAEKVFSQRVQEMIQSLKVYARAGEEVPEEWQENPTLIQTLLDRHYAECYHKAAPEPTETVWVDFGNAIQGTGWHHREQVSSDNSLFRWTGPGTISTLDVNVVRDRPLCLTFRVINAIHTDVLDSLQVLVNGNLTELEVLDGAGSTVRTYRTTIPQTWLNPADSFVRLAFQVEKTLSPHSQESWNPDRRKLGVAIHWVDLRPMDASGATPLPDMPSSQDLVRMNQVAHFKARLKHIAKEAPGISAVYRTWKRIKESR
jgi:hypothetical protein